MMMGSAISETATMLAGDRSASTLAVSDISHPRELKLTITVANPYSTTEWLVGTPTFDPGDVVGQRRSIYVQAGPARLKGADMTSTIERPASGLAEPPGQPHGPSRVASITIAALAVIVIALGVTVVYQASGDDSPKEVPDDVQALLDDFVIANETYDYEAFQTLVTDNFRRPLYEGDPTEGPGYRNIMRTQDFDFFEEEEPEWEIDQVGDAIVQGDGPWYISVAQNWEKHTMDIRIEAVYTYVVIVDTDGVLRIDDGYWAGHPVASGG